MGEDNEFYIIQEEQQMIDTDLLIAYEEGTLEREDFLKLFQQIYDSSSLQFQGHYGPHFLTPAQFGLINLK